AWSRDGRRIAFVRSDAGGCALLVVAASGGGEREVGRCEGGDFAAFDWTPDGRGLVMGGRSRGNGQPAPLRRLTWRAHAGSRWTMRPAAWTPCRAIHRTGPGSASAAAPRWATCGWCRPPEAPRVRSPTCVATSAA